MGTFNKTECITINNKWSDVMKVGELMRELKRSSCGNLNATIQIRELEEHNEELTSKSGFLTINNIEESDVSFADSKPSEIIIELNPRK